MKPGSTKETLMPQGRTSYQRASVAPSRANFEALYTAMVGIAIIPPTEETLMIRPWRRARIRGNTMVARRIGERKLMSI